MTLRAFLSQIQRYVLEPTVDGGRTWALGLWDAQEILALVYAVELDFIRRTPVVRGWQIQAYAPNQAVATLDPDVQEILHAETDQEGTGRPLPSVSRLEADAVLPAWHRTTTRPRGYIHEDSGTATLTLVPAPAAAGQLHLLVVPEPQRHTAAAPDDDPLTVGDLWTPFLLAGVLARMFGKPGQAYNAERRDRCAALYELGITLAQARRPAG